MMLLVFFPSHIRAGPLTDLTIIFSQVHRKSSAGYQLNSLFVGSEGTLGLVTEATLKLAPVPTHTGVAVITFPTIKAAASMAVDVVRRGIVIGAIEILDDVQMKVINKIGATGRTWREEPTLFIKFTGDEDVVNHNIKLVKKVAKEHESPSMEFENDLEKQKMLWSARKEALWSMLALRTSGSEVWTTDVAVPLSRVAELIGKCSHFGFVLITCHITSTKINFRNCLCDVWTFHLSPSNAKRTELSVGCIKQSAPRRISTVSTSSAASSATWAMATSTKRSSLMAPRSDNESRRACTGW